MRRSIIAFLVLLALSPMVIAETRYVTDQFEIMLRTGPSIQNKIVVVLTSGAELEVLNAEAGNGYSQIRTSKGEVGYALTRFLVTTPSARNRVSYLEEQLKQLRSKPAELVALLATSQEDNQVLIDQNTGLSELLNIAEAELTEIKKVSADAVNLSLQNQRLEGEVQQLLLQLDDTRIQNEDLKDQSDRMQNMMGAGLVLLGLFLGWILSISGRRNRNSWSS